MSLLEERIARLEALVERQSAIIAEKDAVIERLQARVAELERKQGGSGSPPASPSSASRPEPSGRKPGGQPGHKGHRRELLQPVGYPVRFLDFGVARVLSSEDSAPFLGKLLIPDLTRETYRRADGSVFHAASGGHNASDQVNALVSKGQRFVVLVRKDPRSDFYFVRGGYSLEGEALDVEGTPLKLSDLWVWVADIQLQVAARKRGG